MCLSVKLILQQNLIVKKFIYLGEIFFSCTAAKLLLLFSKSSKMALLLAMLTRTGEECGPRKSNEQHKILAGLAGSPQCVVFENLSKSCII